MLLPNADRAYIDLRKLSEYCLDPAHPVGRHKAVVFRRVFGFSVRDADILNRLLLDALLDHEAVMGVLDEFGQRYTVDFDVSNSAGAAKIRSAWIIRSGEDFPRLTTCFVLPD